MGYISVQSNRKLYKLCLGKRRNMYPSDINRIAKEEQKLDRQLTRGIATRLQHPGLIKQNKRKRFNLSTYSKSDKASIYKRPPKVAPTLPD